MASLIRRGKLWYIKYYDLNGKQKWVKGYSDKKRSERESLRIEDCKTAERRGDLDPQAEARKTERSRAIAGHVADYKTALQARGSSENHISYTIADIEKFIAHSGVSHATAITRAMIDRWVVTLTKDSARTVNRRVGSVQAFLRYLKEAGSVAEYVLHKYPKKKVKGTERRRRRALTKKECKALIEEAPAERKLIYRFALLTGFRFSEIASMTPSSFNFDQKTVTVRANDAKNKNKNQTIPLNRAITKDMADLCEGKAIDAPLFAMPARTIAARLLRNDCQLAKVDTTHIDFHALRHTYITRLAEGRVHPKVLQELARHSSIETTLTYYTHFRQADERKAINSLAA